MKYAFIERHRKQYPVCFMCKVMRASKTRYYVWRQGRVSKRECIRQELLFDIKQIHAESRGNYGSPKILRELRNKGKIVNHKSVEKLMKDNGIKAKRSKKFKSTTDLSPILRTVTRAKSLQRHRISKGGKFAFQMTLMFFITRLTDSVHPEFRSDGVKITLPRSAVYLCKLNSWIWAGKLECIVVLNLYPDIQTAYNANFTLSRIDCSHKSMKSNREEVNDRN